MSGRLAFSPEHVPYAYFIVKYKRFAHGPQLRCGSSIPPPVPSQLTPSPQGLPAHSCRKPGHSCLRNIISFKKILGRATLKRVGRAFIYALDSVMKGYGIRDLSRGKTTLQDLLGKQLKRTSECPCCVRYGVRLNGPTLYTGDASQAFEVICPKRIERALGMIFNTVKIKTDRRDPTLSCIQSSKAKVKFGGWIKDRLGAAPSCS